LKFYIIYFILKKIFRWNIKERRFLKFKILILFIFVNFDLRKKGTIIILIALILFISLPVFASTPVEENAPASTSENELFLYMTQLSEEELLKIEGNVNNQTMTLDGCANTNPKALEIIIAMASESTSTLEGLTNMVDTIYDIYQMFDNFKIRQLAR